MDGTSLMAKTYAKIQEQIQALTREAEKLRRAEIDGVIARIKEAVTAYGLSAADLGLTGGSAAGKKAAAPKKKGRRKAAAPRKAAAVAKFRDEAGHTWGGRGPRPAWLREALTAGKKLEDFKV